jgi:uncharacterized surface protein with fasciclin (FAS1) repeats
MRQKLLTTLALVCALTLLALPATASTEADCVDTAVAAGSFNTLVAAVKAADLVEALKSDGPFTIFAPTDAAFAKLPDGTVDNLLQPENKAQLQAILKYHVVPAKLDASQVTSRHAAATLQGDELHFSVADGSVNVSGSTVVQADVACSNGVIHVIDSVLLPQ